METPRRLGERQSSDGVTVAPCSLNLLVENAQAALGSIFFSLERVLLHEMPADDGKGHGAGDTRQGKDRVPPMLYAPDPEKLLDGPAIDVHAIGVVVARPDLLEQRREVDAQPEKRIRQGWRHHAGLRREGSG